MEKTEGETRERERSGVRERTERTRLRGEEREERGKRVREEREGEERKRGGRGKRGRERERRKGERRRRLRGEGEEREGRARRGELQPLLNNKMARKNSPPTPAPFIPDPLRHRTCGSGAAPAQSPRPPRQASSGREKQPAALPSLGAPRPRARAAPADRQVPVAWRAAHRHRFATLRTLARATTSRRPAVHQATVAAVHQATSARIGSCASAAAGFVCE